MDIALAGSGIDLGPFVNKSVPFKFNGAELRFDLSQALFSSFDIDTGTRLLLKTVARDPVLASARRILDEGCGVGVIGLCAAKAFPEAEVVLRDRDSLAAAFAERNRLGNKLRGTAAWVDPAGGPGRIARPAPRVEWGLIGDGREGGPFDFVLSNLPAKAGAPVLASFFARLSGISPGLRAAGSDEASRDRTGVPGKALLSPGGRAAVVVVKPLVEATEAWIAQAGLSIVGRGRGSGHEAFVVERAVPDAEAGGAGLSPEPGERALGAYLRGEAKFTLAGLSYRARGFYGLAEFDTPSYGSSVAAELASRACSGCLVREALFLEPGAGHLALWAARELGCSRITAASRDLLSLEAVGRNLATIPERSRPEYAGLDALGAAVLPAAAFDLVAESPDVAPERDRTAESWERASRLLKRGGTYLVSCSPTETSRLEKRRPSGSSWTLLGQRRKKGYIASAWRRN